MRIRPAKRREAETILERGIIKYLKKVVPAASQLRADILLDPGVTGPSGR
jgi:hypothetical protein